MRANPSLRVWAALLAALLAAHGASAATPRLEVVAKDPAGHGLLCRLNNKTILMVSGSPAEMGTAHGTLVEGQGPPAPRARALRWSAAPRACTRASGSSIAWPRSTAAPCLTFPRVSSPSATPCPRPIGISQRDGRYANLFPERFHCSGVAVRGKASLGGRVLHARVLDYMRDINLQQAAAVRGLPCPRGGTAG